MAGGDDPVGRHGGECDAGAEGDAGKSGVGCWLRERATVSLRWISERLALGHSSKAGRGPRKLKASDERQRRRAMATPKRIV